MRMVVVSLLAIAVVACGDDPAPQVVLVSPAVGAAEVAARPAVLVVFDQAIDPASVAADSLTLRRVDGDAIGGTLEVATTAVSLWPDAPLVPGRYEARLAAGITDPAGHAAPGRTWSFTVTARIDDAAPRIVWIDPPDTGRDAARTAPIRVFFDETIAPTTTARLQLEDAWGNAIDGRVEHLGSVLQLTPATALAPSTAHRAMLTGGIADLDGNVVAADHRWTFETTTGPGRWSAPRLTSPTGYPAGLAADRLGGVHVAWAQDRNLWHLRHDAVTGWGSAVPVSDAAPGDVVRGALGVADDGQARAVWLDLAAPTMPSIRASGFTPGVGWGAATVLSSDVRQAFDAPHVAVAPNGMAAAVWSPAEPAIALAIRRFVPGSGWLAVEEIAAVRAGAMVFAPQVAASPTGEVVVVWLEANAGVDATAAAATFTPATGWTPAMRLGTAALAEAPRLAMNRAGQAEAVWVEAGEPASLWTRRWADGAWEPARALAPLDGAAALFDVAFVDDAAIVAWTDADRSRIVVSQRTPGAWPPPTVVAAAPELGAARPCVAIGADGEAVVAWSGAASNQSRTLWAARYKPTGGWERPSAVAAGLGRIDSIDAVVDANRVPTLLWSAGVSASTSAVFVSRGLP